MNPALLALKYKGVRTPWEILADPTKFGWQCRKYLRWSAVQTEQGDRAALKSMADALIDEGALNAALLPTISRIFERVQRWRKDKENFAVEPDEREGYIDLRRNVALAAENPGVIPDLLFARLSVELPRKYSGADVVQYFYAASVFEFLRSFDGGPFQRTGNALSKVADPSAHVAKEVVRVYREFGLPIDKSLVASDLLIVFLKDIGIAAKVGTFNSERSSVKLDSPSTIVETFEGLASQFVKTEFRQGQLYVAYNLRHPWIAVNSGSENRVDELFRAIGDATLSMLGDMETVDAFLEHLGIALARITKKREHH